MQIIKLIKPYFIKPQPSDLIIHFRSILVSDIGWVLRAGLYPK